MQTSCEWQPLEQLSTLEAVVPLKRAATLHEEDSKTKRTRGRTGCLNCRRRRKKCDEVKPDCTKCRVRGEECKWDNGITFRLTGLDAQHPSMLQSRPPKQSASGFKIVDVRFQSDKTTSRGEILRSQEIRPLCETDSPPIQHPEDDGLADIDVPVSNSSVPPSTTQASVTTCVPSKKACGESDRPKCRPFPFADANPVDMIMEEPSSPAPAFEDDIQVIDYPRSNSDGSTSVPSGPWSNDATASSVSSTSERSNKADSPVDEPHDFDHGLTNFDSLDYLVNLESPKKTRELQVGQSTPGDILTKSRLKLCRDIRSLIEARARGSSDVGANASANALQSLNLNEGYRGRDIRLLRAPLTARPLGCTKLMKRRQLELWRNYIDKIGPWLDVCGSKRYFQQSLPPMAKSADHLHYSILALSARHIELRTPGSLFTESTGLYQDAVQLLSTELPSLETTVIASCVLLCVLEMMSSHPESVETLKACANLMEAADVNSKSGGIRQAIFWTFANLSLFNGVLGLQQDILPVRQFYPSDCLSTAVSYIRSLTWGEGYAKYAIFLSSAVESAIMTPTRANGANKAAGWKALFELIEDWFNCRPEDMQPLMSYPSILDDCRHPFPMLLYGSAPAVVGNLLYHTASILLLQNKPEEIEIAKTQKSILWHARQTCGIVGENQDHGSWISGIRPLWIAGKVVKNEGEHQSIVDIFTRIERSTGWRNSWYVESLKQHWKTE